MTYCWLVELFEPGGNSMGHYHTGFTEFLPFESRTTRDPNKARRYATRVDALMVCARLLHAKGVWRAVEHGFEEKPSEFECLGEPSLCTNPRGCACVPDNKTPNA